MISMGMLVNNWCTFAFSFRWWQQRPLLAFPPSAQPRHPPPARHLGPGAGGDSEYCEGQHTVQAWVMSGQHIRHGVMCLVSGGGRRGGQYSTTFSGDQFMGESASRLILKPIILSKDLWFRNKGVFCPAQDCCLIAAKRYLLNLKY